MTRRTFVSGLVLAAGAPGASPAPSTMGLSPDCFGISKRPRTPYELLEFAHSIGAGGVQAVLTSFDTEYLKKVRQRVEEYGMYLEITIPLPAGDTSEFERAVRASKEAGAHCLRSVCLSGRRYENFSTLEEWREFVAGSRAKLGRIAPILERNRIALGIENHKDFTAEEMAPLMKECSSEYLGTCLDWGNNLSLLDDPYELVEALAPFVINSHIKDVAVEEYDEGFLLAEVALGQGILDLPRILNAIRKRRPNVRFSLDMLTRNPLKITCLTPKYWVTMPARNGRFLAGALSMVRANKPRNPLRRIDGMDDSAKRELEMRNVRESLDYARDQLGLRPA
jgi:3-oxoisoapionate decarboxylase